MNSRVMTTDVEAAYDSLIEFLYLAPIGLAQTLLDGEIVMINPISAKLLMPLSKDGDLSNLFTVLDDVAPAVRELATAFDMPRGMVCDGLRIEIPASLRRGDAQTLAISLLKQDDSRFMAVVADVTLDAQREQQTLARQSLRAARTDALTQLPNRTVAVELVGQAMALATADPSCEFAVLFLDSDRFKQISDTHGHVVGDELLRMIGGRLQGALRNSDLISRAADAAQQTAMRIGGDEFAVVVQGLRHCDDAHAVAQRILDVLSKPYGIGALQLHSTFSMGMVLKAQAAGEPDHVLQDASIAMSEAKRAGGGRYAVFEPEMQARASRRGGMEAELRRALGHGELFVVYQPVIDMRGDGVAGVEALVRWRHPVRGMVGPVEFIGVAEECGLIGALGEFVLDAACRQHVKWQQEFGAHAPRTMAVNLSRAQLSLPGLVERVRQILVDSGMTAERLQLEVTESLAAQDETVQARLHELKALGLTLALDDFGTGYSSLASLHLLPVDTVKIDRSFVSQADTSQHHRVLIEATVRVALSLGMSTVAEGVETEGQSNVLRALHCDKGQGYLFSKPLPADDLSAWLEARRQAVTQRAVRAA